MLIPALLTWQVQGLQPVFVRGAEEQAAPLEPVPGRLLPQLCRSSDTGVGQELPAGVCRQHGGRPPVAKLQALIAHGGS